MFTRQQAIELWQSDDLIALGFEADCVRKRLHPEGLVTYTNSGDDEVIEYVFTRSQSVEERLDALAAIRARQEKTRDITAFRPMVEPTATATEYLKTIAVSRLCLDNVLHIQSNWRLFGLKLAQLALRFGADDLGSPDGNVSEEELRRLIRDAGFVPKRRDTLFLSYSIR
jgi:2-iminoacetate synthase ThiH